MTATGQRSTPSAQLTPASRPRFLYLHEGQIVTQCVIITHPGRNIHIGVRVDIDVGLPGCLPRNYLAMVETPTRFN